MKQLKYSQMANGWGEAFAKISVQFDDRMFEALDHTAADLVKTIPQ